MAMSEGEVRRPVGGYRALLLTGVGVVILAAALIFQFTAGNPGMASAAIQRMDLAARLPSRLLEWQSKDLPLGPNELLRNQTAEILRYDEYVFREYSQGARNFAVYAAYWAPGKMPTRFVALHTPDRCWTENGWTCLDQKYEVQIQSSGVRLLPTQWRVFNPPGGQAKQYVYFWLLVGGQSHDFGQRLNTIPNPVKWWQNVVDEARAGNPEHLFVRVTSDRPFEELAGDPGWEELLGALARLGLEARDKG